MSNPPRPDLPAVGWIEASNNPWGVRVLDVRPATQTMLSTSKDQRCAANSASFRGDEGLGFVGVKPTSDRSISTSLRYPRDGYLSDGVLFSPAAMEHKWAIFLHAGKIIFVRSWLREVVATAELEREDGFAVIRRIDGTLIPNESPDFSVRMADYLIRTHGMHHRFPAPLPPGIDQDPSAAALWCMNVFGKKAEFATSQPIEAPPPATPVRTDSLLHIAVAKGNRPGILGQLDAGVPVTLLAKDGLAPPHWAVAGKAPDIAELLLERGCPVDVRSADGATPLMNAVQSGRADWVDFFLSRAADPNAADTRGFTALHRAAEMGKTDMVRRLLSAGARANVEAEGHTPLSLAQGRNETEIVSLLTGH